MVFTLCYKTDKIMGYKSTKEISRDKIIKKIEQEIENINKLEDETLCGILEILGEDKNTDISSTYNYIIE